MTMPPFRAKAWQKATLGPVSAHSENSHHCFSRVQKAKGMCLRARKGTEAGSCYVVCAHELFAHSTISYFCSYWVIGCEGKGRVLA
jgi:hypothetical protein